MTVFSFSHFSLLLLLFTPIPSSSLDITSLLSPYPDLSDFTSLLTSTPVSADLHSRSAVTLLAVPNSYLRSSDLLRHSDPSSLADVIRYHVLLQYLSWSDLAHFPSSGKLITTLYQTTGRATNNFGSLNITRNPSNGAVFATSPIPYSPSNATFISSIKSLPYNVSIFTINSLLIPSGFNLVASETRPTPALNITKLLIDGHNFNVAASMLMASGVVEEFEQDEGGAGITMFVPTDTAFSLLSTSQDLQSLPADKKGVVLRFHVLHSYYPLGSLESIVNPVQPTLATEDSGAGRYTLNISKINGSVAIDSGIVQALVTRTVFDQNPVAIFGVSRVLLPKEIFGSYSDPMVMTGPGVVIGKGQAPELSPVPDSYDGSDGPSSFTGGDIKSIANSGTLNLQQRIVAYSCCIGGTRGSDNNNMGTPYASFHEFKKQASFFFKETIKTARLALTDVTPAELLTEEAISGNLWAPNTRTLGLISRAAFEVDDFWRIVEILHKRLAKFEKKNWRVSYNSLVLLEHLLTHGPGSAADEFQADIDVIREMESFQYIDERGFNWGLALRKKSEKILQLLEDGILLKEERDRARKLTREIQGFGSFSDRSSSHQGILKESSSGAYGTRCNSNFNGHENLQHQNSSSSDQDSTGADMKASVSLSNAKVLESLETETKENTVPNTDILDRKSDEWSSGMENAPLSDDRKEETAIRISDILVDHPFNHSEKETTASLLATTD